MSCVVIAVFMYVLVVRIHGLFRFRGPEPKLSNAVYKGKRERGKEKGEGEEEANV